MKKIWILLLILAGSAFRLSAFEGYVDITNKTGFPVYFLFISPSGTDSWGHDLLGNDSVIEEGETLRFELSDQSSSIFDIKIEDVDGDSYIMKSVDLSENRSITFTPEQMSSEENELLGEVTLTGSGGPINGTYYIYNNSSKDILYVYVRKPSGEWSPDLLGEEDVFTNKGLFKVTLQEMPDVLINLKFEDKRGHTYTYRDIDLKETRELIVEKEDRDDRQADQQEEDQQAEDRREEDHQDD